MFTLPTAYYWNELGQKRSDHDILFVFAASKKYSENNNSSWLLIYEQINIHNPTRSKKILLDSLSYFSPAVI